MGFEMALSELSLVFFTTLAPSGTCAVLVMVLIAQGFGRDARVCRAIDQKLWIPLSITLVGLVASATHLGNPSNALYVLLGIGRSPLSNEVAAAVLFLGLSGVYWFYSFSQKLLAWLRKILALAVFVSGLLFIMSIAFAYDAETILTWHSPYVPIILLLTALFGGPLLALSTMNLAKGFEAGSLRMSLGGVSLVALFASLGVLIAQNASLVSAQNSLVNAVDLVPFYPAAIAWYAVCGLMGCVLIGEVPTFKMWHANLRNTVGCIFVFSGIFIIRFCFYMMHMTV